jgi:hypothetical protein
MSAKSPVTEAWIGLKSGGLFHVRIEPGVRGDDAVTVDASQLTLTDVAAGLAGQNRYGHQLRRTYSVAEHSILGSYLFDEDYEQALQFLFHDSAEGLGVGDHHHKLKRLLMSPQGFAVENAITAAVAEKFSVPAHFPKTLKSVDRVLATFEWHILHPARDKMAALGIAADASQDLFTTKQRATVLSWFARTQPTDPARWENLWLDRVVEVRRLLQRPVDVGTAVESYCLTPGHLPYSANLLAPRIAATSNFSEAAVNAELVGHIRAGRLVVRGKLMDLGPASWGTGRA